MNVGAVFSYELIFAGVSDRVEMGGGLTFAHTEQPTITYIRLCLQCAEAAVLKSMLKKIKWQ